MSKKTVALLIVLAAFVAGAIGVPYMAGIYTSVSQWLSSKDAFFITQDSKLTEQFSQENLYPLTWRELMPDEQMALLERYQLDSMNSIEAQMLTALRAANDNAYIDSLVSTATVDTHIGKAVSIPGFIVPLEIDEDRQVTHFFLVPYFGACLHYPPPPPNQIIYVNVEEGIGGIDIEQAYELSGYLRISLFEDPVGTSAYMLDLVKVHKFYDEPDDVRQH